MARTDYLPERFWKPMGKSDSPYEPFRSACEVIASHPERFWRTMGVLTALQIGSGRQWEK